MSRRQHTHDTTISDERKISTIYPRSVLVRDALRELEIQRRIADAEGTGRMPIRIRIGMAAGEPVTERNDLFGATVQLAARLCSRADAGGILVANDLALGKGFAFRSRGRPRLKGFDSQSPPSKSYGGQVDRDPHRPTLRKIRN
jgi:class 3 adenylate cyclase